MVDIEMEMSARIISEWIIGFKGGKGGGGTGQGISTNPNDGSHRLLPMLTRLYYYVYDGSTRFIWVINMFI